MSEIIFLAVLALVVIGPKQLPELARTLGRFLNELKRSTSSLTDELKEHTRIDTFSLDDISTRKKPEPRPKKDVASEPALPEQMELPQQEPAQHDGTGDKKSHE